MSRSSRDGRLTKIQEHRKLRKKDSHPESEALRGDEREVPRARALKGPNAFPLHNVKLAIRFSRFDMIVDDIRSFPAMAAMYPFLSFCLYFYLSYSKLALGL